jgi:paraquat-inducible protein B
MVGRRELFGSSSYLTEIGGLMIRRFFMLWLLAFTVLGCDDSGLNLKIRYNEIRGLKEGDRVIFEKNHVGQVVGVFYSKEGFYTVDVMIKEEFANAATEHSQFFITADPEDEGEKAIEIVQSQRGGKPLAEDATVVGADKSTAPTKQVWDEFAEGLEDLKEQLERFSDDLRKIPESEEFKKLKKELERLSEEMKKSSEAAREKIEKEILPRLRREMEKLREKLRKFDREQETEPLEVQLENIRKL